MSNKNTTVISNIQNKVQTILNEMTLVSPYIDSYGMGDMIPMTYDAPLLWVKIVGQNVKSVSGVKNAFLKYNFYYLDNIADATTQTRLNQIMTDFLGYQNYLEFVLVEAGTNTQISGKGYFRANFEVRIDIEALQPQDEGDCGCNIITIQGEQGEPGTNDWNDLLNVPDVIVNIQDELDAKEDKINKVTNFLAPNNTTYATTLAITNYVMGLLDNFSLDNLDDVNISSVQDDQLLKYDVGTGQWINWTPVFPNAYADLTDVNLTSLQDGQLTKYDAVTQKWVNFTHSFALQTRNLTINGVSFDLSNDRTWNVGTVTSVTPTDSSEIDFTITNQTTTPNITASIIPGSIANSKLTNSTISGIPLGSNLNTLTITSPLTGTSYDGSSAITIGLAGLTSLGAANRILGMNNAATGYEYKSLTVGTSGTDFNIAHTANAVTFNIPDASASNRGVVTTSSQTFAGSKTFSSDLTIGTARFGRGGGSVSTNIAIGVSAGNATMTNGTSTPNVLIGNSAGTAITNGYSHIYLGYRSGYSQTSGDNNIGIGYRALYTSVNTYFNIAIGSDAGYNITNSAAGLYNTIVGHNSGKNIGAGGRNVAFGFYSLGLSASSGSISYNCGYGQATLANLVNGNYNIAIGANALYTTTNSNYQIALGYNAGYYNTGNSNVWIGGYDGASHTSVSNNIFFSDGEGNIRARCTSNGNWMFGYASPVDAGYKMDVNGTLRVQSVLTVGSITITSGTGSPEGVITANVGSTFHRTNGGAGTSFYVKESGTGNTGWVAK